ncbi:apoptosis facilitator Bcl-2-like protein 14 [Limanda limanda]|uniref:apoptosis facilitator Bcl-2-like protein 14 n=1 Tax=Limanda limanda TaxID=27771 RepID=UPI0029C8D2B0|nr:apoptosis facilitator Bcl-2-like protein 14 [Limanda limanda]XP_060926726.1 apoptosis facilitator Bcl-2-like protein 14 [Limanda limanda]
MANGQIEIHDPFINQHDLTRDEDAASSSDTEDMEDTPEFRLLMAYAKRRRGNKESPGQNGNGTPPPSTPLISPDTPDEKKKKKKKKGWKRLLRCIKPQTRDEEPGQASNPEHEVHNRCGFRDIEPVENEDFDKAAECLTGIADDFHFVPSEIDTDSPEDSVERMIGLLLREKGDELNERELKDLSLDRDIFWSYDFFKAIMTTLFDRMGFRSSAPDSPGPQASPKANMALALEATNRLAALETLPSKRINNYGAKYVKENHSSWAQEHGGYEEAFEHDDEEDD